MSENYQNTRSIVKIQITIKYLIGIILTRTGRENDRTIIEYIREGFFHWTFLINKGVSVPDVIIT